VACAVAPAVDTAARAARRAAATCSPDKVGLLEQHFSKVSGAAMHVVQKLQQRSGMTSHAACGTAAVATPLLC